MQEMPVIGERKKKKGKSDEIANIFMDVFWLLHAEN